MATAIELALQRAVAAKEAAEAKPNNEREQRLSSAVADWSSDDKVHVDPPLQQPTTTPQEANPMIDHALPQQQENAMTASPQPRQLQLPDPKEVGPTEACFRAARDNPGTARATLVNALIERGYKPSSVSSLLGAMVRAKLIKYDNQGGMHATRRTFPGLGNVYKSDKRAKPHPVNIDKVHQTRAGIVPIKRGRLGDKPEALLDHVLTAQERGALANMLRWGNWDKLAKLYGRKYSNAKRRQKEMRNGLTPLEAKRASAGLPPKMTPEAERTLKVMLNTPPNKERKVHPLSIALTTTGKDWPGTKVKKALDSEPGRNHPTQDVQRQNTVPGLPSLTPEQLVRGLTLVQAKAVYNLLRAYFKD